VRARRKAVNSPRRRTDAWAAWRAERLRRAGFPEPLADRLAHQPEVDIHAVLELVDRGCRPDLAVRILAPLDPPAAPPDAPPADPKLLP
jgi:hypothetical protein